jgi:hypothetical protein
MLIALLMFAKWWKFTAKKRLSYIINVYFKFSKKKIKFIMTSKIKLKVFQINLSWNFLGV